MNIKNALLSGLLLASCSSKTPVHQGAGPAGPNTPDTGTDSSTAQHPQGTITSSGGYLYGFETNPWFLQNTEEVKYCIDMDEENFGVTKEKAQSAITFAIDTWKSQLQKVEYDRFGEEELKPWREIRLGTQTFSEVSCDDQNVSLRLQLGKLSEAQKVQVGDPKRYVAKAFETSYDEINMRGAGFIYLAPESGPLRPDEPNAEEHFWTRSDGFSLKYVLMHEMGHVFGFGHSENLLMAEDGPQMSINKDVPEHMESFGLNNDGQLKTWLSYLFGHSDDAMGLISRLGTQDLNQELFAENAGRDHAIHCDNKTYVVCSMYEVTSTEQGDRVRGKKVGQIEGNIWSFGSKSAGASVKIPRSQTVLTISDSLRTEFGPGNLRLGTARAKRFEVKGSYVSEDGKVKIPMRVRSMEERPAHLHVEVFYKDWFHVIAQ